MEQKIGLGIVTYNRPEYIKQCLKAAKENNWGGADFVFLYDDGSSKENQDIVRELCLEHKIDFNLCQDNMGVAHAKNECLRELIDRECTHLFIMEDDQLIQHPKICDYYIQYSQIAGIKHLNFALHGPMNKGHASTFSGICVYPHCVGAFSYYHKDVIEQVGYMDENFKNAWEHVEHTYRIAKTGLTTPFWKFADHPFSDRLIKEIPGSIDYSSIRPRDDWQKNIQEGQEYWISKHGEFLPPRSP